MRNKEYAALDRDIQQADRQVFGFYETKVENSACDCPKYSVTVFGKNACATYNNPFFPGRTSPLRENVDYLAPLKDANEETLDPVRQDDFEYVPME